MNINNRTSVVAFLAALSAISVSNTASAARLESSNIDERLSRLSASLQARAQQLPKEKRADVEQLMARGFADGSRGGWTDARRGGWADGAGGGSFTNVNPWRNGWVDGGGFVNWYNS